VDRLGYSISDRPPPLHRHVCCSTLMADGPNYQDGEQANDTYPVTGPSAAQLAQLASYLQATTVAQHWHFRVVSDDIGRGLRIKKTGSGLAVVWTACCVFGRHRTGCAGQVPVSGDRDLSGYDLLVVGSAIGCVSSSFHHVQHGSSTAEQDSQHNQDHHVCSEPGLRQDSASGWLGLHNLFEV
jgi:hypothetical protein